MSFADDFNSILSAHGSTISVITVTRTITDGYVSEAETTTTITAIIQPLKAEDLRFLEGLGYTAEDLKAYVAATESVSVGDEIDYNGNRYLVQGIEKQQAYMKLLLKLKK